VVGIIRVAWDIQLKIGGLPRIWGQIGRTIMAGHIQLPTFNKQEKGHFSTNWHAATQTSSAYSDCKYAVTCPTLLFRMKLNAFTIQRGKKYRCDKHLMLKPS